MDLLYYRINVSAQFQVMKHLINSNGRPIHIGIQQFQCYFNKGIRKI